LYDGLSVGSTLLTGEADTLEPDVWTTL
jgi:hypothetical protein